MMRIVAVLLCASVGAAGDAGARVYVGVYDTHDAASCPDGGGFDPAGYAGQTLHQFSLGGDGALTHQGAVAAGLNASWVAWHPARPLAYAVNEVCTYSGKAGASITTLAVDSGSGALSPISAVATRGQGPVQASVSRDGRFLLAACYFSGTLEVFSIDAADGSLSGPIQVIDQGPGSHSVVLDPRPESRFVFSAVLGKDTVRQYVQLANGTLVANPAGSAVSLPLSTGPRHIAFSPPPQLPARAYVADEGNFSTAPVLTVCAYDPSSGVMTTKQTLSTVPSGTDPHGMYPAEVLVEPGGRWVYVSVRDSTEQRRDTVAVFSVTAAGVTPQGHVPTGGHYPRSMALSSDGRHLIVANQFSNNVTTFTIDTSTGKPHPTGHAASLPDSAAFVTIRNL